jgi:hypothetical protein
MDIAKCPQCGGELEHGRVNAPSFGVVWTTHSDVKWGFFLSKKIEKLQKDWWGFPKLSKDWMPGLRCPECKLVVFQYSNEGR